MDTGDFIQTDVFQMPKYVWEMKLFGDDGVILRYEADTVPNAWVRFWCTFFLRSKWTRINDEEGLLT